MPPGERQTQSSNNSSAERRVLSESLTLIAVRWLDGDVRIIAVGSYFPRTRSAGVGRGGLCGRRSLSRQGARHRRCSNGWLRSAIRHGLHRFVATTTGRQLTDARSVPRLGIRNPVEIGAVAASTSSCRSTHVAGSASAEENRHRLATAASLRPLLEPRAVAVVGASRDPASIGRRVLDAVIAGGFKGAIHPVNPQATEIAGLPAYRSARDLPRRRRSRDCGGAGVGGARRGRRLRGGAA